MRVIPGLYIFYESRGAVASESRARRIRVSFELETKASAYCIMMEGGCTEEVIKNDRRYKYLDVNPVKINLMFSDLISCRDRY